MASDMDLEQQEREEELKRLEEDVKNSDVALDKLNSEYEEQMDEMAEEPEQEHGKVWLFFGKLHKALEKNLGRNIIIGVYAITVLRIIADLVMFMRGVFYVDYAMVPRNFFYYFFSIVIPYAVWIWSTKQSFTFFAFTNRKMRGLWIASISLCTVILNVMFLCTCMVAVPLIMLIPVSPDVTGSMIVNLTRLITFMLPVFVFSSCIKGFIDIYQFSNKVWRLIDKTIAKIQNNNYVAEQKWFDDLRTDFTALPNESFKIKSQKKYNDICIDENMIASYEYEHNDGDQIWSDTTEFYKDKDTNTFVKKYQEGYTGEISYCSVLLDDIIKDINRIKEEVKIKESFEVGDVYRRGGYSLYKDISKEYYNDSLNDFDIELD